MVVSELPSPCRSKYGAISGRFADWVEAEGHGGLRVPARSTCIVVSGLGS